MGKYFYTIVGLLFSLNSAFSQEHYYWANGRKYPLELQASKHYILTTSNKKELVAMDLGISPEDVFDLRQLTISKSIKNNSSGNSSGKNGIYWGFVNRLLSSERVKSSEILYSAPSFRVNETEIGLSQFFYVKLKRGQDIELLENLARENKVEVVGNDSFMPLWYILSCDRTSKGNALEMANLFYETGMFTSAQPDFMEDYNANCRNDTFFNQQWHLNNTGQSGGIPGNDIRMCQAWDVTTGCGNIIVAVVDDGLEVNHPDFNNISPISFDSETGTSPAAVIYGPHGVPVGGIIGAAANNSLGVAGVAPNAQLMSISNSGLSTPLSRQNRAAGINFAWQNGASVINNSWISAVAYQIINDAIQNAVALGRNGLGTVVIFASGNGGNSSISYPSSNANTISVGAIGRAGSRASFSNYGPGLDVVAPGVEITTTDRQGTGGYNSAAGPAGDYATLNGTSYAAPQVAGIAALILSVNPTLTVQQVRNIIESTTDKVGGVAYSIGAGEQAGLTWNNQMGYGRVNAFNAVQAALPIVGPGVICSAGSYQINSLPPGATVTWISSNPNGLSINSTTGVATRVNNFNGRITLTATINGGCAPVNVRRDIGVGNYVPAGTSSVNSNCSGNTFNIINTSLSAACTANTAIYFSYKITDPNYTNLVFTPVSVPSGASWSFNGGNLNMTVYTPSSQGSRSATIRLNATGPCGPYSVNFTSTAVNYYSSPFSISPNPSKENVTVSTDNENSLNDHSPSLIYGIKITDPVGTLGESFEYKAGINTVTIPLQNFNSGLYILSVFDGKMWSSERLIIQK